MISLTCTLVILTMVVIGIRPTGPCKCQSQPVILKCSQGINLHSQRKNPYQTSPFCCPLISQWNVIEKLGVSLYILRESLVQSPFEWNCIFSIWKPLNPGVYYFSRVCSTFPNSDDTLRSIEGWETIGILSVVVIS